MEKVPMTKRGHAALNAELKTLQEEAAELEDLIGRAEVIDPAKFSDGTIRFGATVEIVDEDTDEEKVYQIVGEPEADIDRGKLNLRSPLARALIGKEKGDSVEVMTPGGGRSYEILDVRYL
jgi:transcription elongation factor GreA